MTIDIDISLPSSVLNVIDAIEAEGGEAWVVGGSVRDAVLGRETNDFDIACSMPWMWTKSIIENHGWKCCETGTKYGTITAIVDAESLEITTYRQEKNYLDNRHPSEISIANCIEDDLSRRDFTINALAFHPKKGILDTCGGMQDLRNGIIRAVGSADSRMEEDALRILRGIRFSSQLSFDIEPATLKAMSSHAAALSKIAVERIAVEMDKLLCGKNAPDVLISQTDILGVFLPELLPMKGCDQHCRYHIYDVLEHTANVVRHVEPEPFMRWCALLHDIGKPSVKHVDSRGISHFKGHEAKGAEMARVILKRLRYPNNFIEDACKIIRLHDTYRRPSKESIQQTLQLLDGNESLARSLFNLMIADSRAKAPGMSNRYDIAVRNLELLDVVLEEKLPYSLSHLAINGNDLLNEGMKPGKELGQLLSYLLDEVISGNVSNDKESLLHAAKLSSIFRA